MVEAHVGGVDDRAQRASSTPRGRSRSRAALGAAALLVVAGGAGLPGGRALAGGAGPDEARIELGRRLFFDPAVSRSGENACAQCHDPEKSFSSRERIDLDDFTTARRRSQTLLDAADGHAFHWDGEFDTIEELVTARLGTPSGLNPSGYGQPPVSEQPQREVTLIDAQGEAHLVDLTRIRPVADRVQADGRYAELFRASFGSASVTAARLGEAIGAYVKTIRSSASAYDRYAAGDRQALSGEARRGLALFRGRAGCVQCHLIEGAKAPFTDRLFHNTGVTAHSLLYAQGTITGPARGALADSDDAPRRPDRGHGRLTSVPTDDAAFKTPTLRDVGRRAPYMHDGSFETLEDVVRHYSKGATKNPNLDPKIRPFDASEGDVADLVAFLRSLTGETRSAAAPDWKPRVKATRIRLLDAAGHPLAGLRATLTPAGDRLPGDSLSAEASREVVSDAEGLFTYEPARRTHMRIDLPAGLRPPGGGMVPDTCEKLDLRLAVAGRADLVLLLPSGAEAPPMLTANADAASEEVDLRKPDALARPMAFAFRRPRPVFVKDAEAVLAGMRLIRYRAWIETGTPKEGTLRFPLAGQPTVRTVDLRPGAETRIALLPAVTTQPSPGPTPATPPASAPTTTKPRTP